MKMSWICVFFSYVCEKINNEIQTPSQDERRLFFIFHREQTSLNKTRRRKFLAKELMSVCVCDAKWERHDEKAEILYHRQIMDSNKCDLNSNRISFLLPAFKWPLVLG